MTREALEHLQRAAAAVTGESTFNRLDMVSAPGDVVTRARERLTAYASKAR